MGLATLPIRAVQPTGRAPAGAGQGSGNRVWFTRGKGSGRSGPGAPSRDGEIYLSVLGVNGEGGIMRVGEAGTGRTGTGWDG